MENSSLKDILSASAKLEESVGRVYLLLSKLYTEDREFWVKLYTEEMNHAAIFRAFLDERLPISLLPSEILDDELTRIRSNIKLIEEELDGFLVKHKLKSDAYRFALELEELAGESRFQDAMDKDSNAEALFLIQRINKDDRDHKTRIQELMKQLA